MWRIGSAKDWGGVRNGGMIAVLYIKWSKGSL